MKKYVAMLLALVMLFALCACGRKIIGAGVFAPNSKKKENLGENPQGFKFLSSILFHDPVLFPV